MSEFWWYTDHTTLQGKAKLSNKAYGHVYTAYLNVLITLVVKAHGQKKGMLSFGISINHSQHVTLASVRSIYDQQPYQISLDLFVV